MKKAGVTGHLKKGPTTNHHSTSLNAQSNLQMEKPAYYDKSPHGHNQPKPSDHKRMRQPPESLPSQGQSQRRDMGLSLPEVKGAEGNIS